MQIVIPVFFIFTIYSVVNTYLPLVLSSIGYNITQTGFLISIFDFSGTFLTMICVSFIEKKRNYGIPLLLLTLPCVILSIPINTIHNFHITALCLFIYAIGYRGLVPVSDSVINNILGSRSRDYGKVRSVGSLSFVLMAFTLQFFLKGKVGSPLQMILWMAAPPLLTSISFFLVPGLMSGKSGVPKKDEEAFSVEKKKFSFVASLSGFSAMYWNVIGLILIAYIALSPINKFFSLYVSDFLHLDAAPFFWAIQALVEIPFMILSGRLLRRFGNNKLLVVSIFAISVRLLIYILIPNFAGAFIGQLLNALTFGLFHPVAVSYICENVPVEKHVTGLSLYTIVANGLGNILGSAIGGVVIDKYGYQTLFLGAACLPVLGIGIFSYIKRKLVLKKE